MKNSGLEKSKMLYQRVARWLQKYAKSFGIHLTEGQIAELKILFTVIRYVDHENDSTRDNAERVLFQREILKTIIYGNKSVKFKQEIETSIFPLLNILNEKGIRIEFAELVGKIFLCSDKIREVRSVKELVELTLQEGELTAELILLFLGVEKNIKFGRFVLSLGRTGNVVDTLFDLRSDWSRGEIQIKPRFSNYVMYVWCILVEVFQTILHMWHHPRLFVYVTHNVLETKGNFSGRMRPKLL